MFHRDIRQVEMDAFQQQVGGYQGKKPLVVNYGGIIANSLARPVVAKDNIPG
jgi:hypothetical protein